MINQTLAKIENVLLKLENLHCSPHKLANHRSVLYAWHDLLLAGAAVDINKVDQYIEDIEVRLHSQ